MLRVLIVDDSASTRRVLSELFVRNGFDAVVAADARQGAAMALSNPPDAVVSDLWMPGMSGLQLCRLLHEDPTTRRVPIVLLSASSDQRSRFWGARSGASAFVEKARIQDLPAVVTSLCDRAVREASAPAPHPVAVEAIPNRLSDLLDEALFNAVLAGELRGLALKHADIRTLFTGFVYLLNEVVSYSWCGLSFGGGVCIHVPVEQPHIVEATLAALDASGQEPFMVVEDETLVAPSANAKSETICHQVEYLDTIIGRLAVGVIGRPATRDTEVIALAAREIALSLRLVALIENTQKDAAKDPLTGLANRRSGMEALLNATQSALRHGYPVTIALVDIDRFKAINDAHGHRAGDRALRHLATIVQRSMRRSDVLVRWSGAMFLAILPDTPTPGARIWAERVRFAIAASTAVIDGDTTIQATASIGIATWAGDTTESLVQRAGDALAAAKSAGRNRVESIEATVSTTDSSHQSRT